MPDEPESEDIAVTGSCHLPVLALSTADALPAGVRPLVMGATFGRGLILTVFAGGELFTGYVMYLGSG